MKGAYLRYRLLSLVDMKRAALSIIVILAAGGAVAWFLIMGDISSWPTAPCKIVSSRVVRADGAYGPHGALMVMYKGEYQYRYTVSGRDYVVWANAGWLDKDRDFVQSKVEILPATCSASVRYNPRRPEQAVVR